MRRRILGGLLILPLLTGAFAVVRAQSQPQISNAERQLEEILQRAQKLKEDGEYEQATSLLERTLPDAEGSLGPNHPALSVLLSKLSALYYAKGDYDRAEQVLLRAISIAQQNSAPASYLATLNGNLEELRRAKRVRDKVLVPGQSNNPSPPAEPATTISESKIEKTVMVQRMLKECVRLREQGQFDKAQAWAQQALKMAEAELGPVHFLISAAYTNLGHIAQAQLEYEQAKVFFERALDMAEKSNGAQDLMVALAASDLATFSMAMGEFTSAEALLRRALPIEEKAFGPDSPDYARELNNFGMLYRAMGDPESSLPYLKRVVEIVEKANGPNSPELITAYGNLGGAYFEAHNYEEADRLFERALALGEKLVGPDSPVLSPTITNLAALHIQRHEYSEAEVLYTRSLKMAEQVMGPENPLVAVDLVELGDIDAQQGRYNDAEQMYQRALAMFEKAFGPYHIQVGQTLGSMAALYWRKNDFANAVSYLARSNDINERSLALRLMTGSDKQKLTFVSNQVNNTSGTVSLHIRSAPENMEAARLALTTVLRRKGRVLDAMSDQTAALRSRLAPQDRELLDQLSAARQRLAGLVLGGNQTNEPSDYTNSVAKLESEVQRLESEMSLRTAEFRPESRPVTIEEVQTALPHYAALVEIARYREYNVRAARGEEFGTPYYAAYVLHADGKLSWVDLGQAARIDSDSVQLRDALRDPKRSDTQELARAFDERVMRPIRKLLGNSRTVLISPDGALNLIPFGALVDEQNHYLVENYSFVYLTSGRDLLRLGARSLSKQGPVVIANPLYDLDGTQRPVCGQPQPGVGRAIDFARAIFCPLKGTGEEAQALSAIIPEVKVLTQSQATEGALKRLHSPSILHLATHGFFLEDRGNANDAQGDRQLEKLAGSSGHHTVIQNPLLRSGLAFAGANQRRDAEGDDGILTALEAAGLDLRGTRLVVLSACETGLGDVKNGEGVYGLRRAFVIAGAESQVMSLWQVSDIATRDLMVAYYKRLLSGEGRAEALRQVQLEMLRSVDRKHPFYWASFIESGAWTPITAK